VRQGEPRHSHRLDQVPSKGGTPVFIRAVGDARPAPDATHIVDKDVDANAATAT
jgi:hypothetical protein